jgi:2'-5' RNA ligase
MRGVAHEVGQPVLQALRYRETVRVGMVVLVEDEPRRAYVLAGRLMLRLEDLGVYRRESRSWLPHVTVARFREPPRLSPPAPDLGTFSPSEVALYHSVLRPTGAQYEVLEAVALGG